MIVGSENAKQFNAHLRTSVKRKIPLLDLILYFSQFALSFDGLFEALPKLSSPALFYRTAGLSMHFSCLPKSSSLPPALLRSWSILIRVPNELERDRSGLPIRSLEEDFQVFTVFGIFPLKRLSRMRTAVHSLGRGTLNAVQERIVKQEDCHFYDRSGTRQHALEKQRANSYLIDSIEAASNSSGVRVTRNWMGL
jgi:hypothetical protein